LKTKIASKYGLDSSPRLVDIIAAVPHDAKKILLPKLKAKPIRTASGVSTISQFQAIQYVIIFLDCCCCCHVQASSLSSHQLHWQHLRLLPGWT